MQLKYHTNIQKKRTLQNELRRNSIEIFGTNENLDSSNNFSKNDVK